MLAAGILKSVNNTDSKKNEILDFPPTLNNKSSKNSESDDIDSILHTSVWPQDTKNVS